MILYVCTGNTCRSPMAEALTRATVREYGLAISVQSAGTMAWKGNASAHAVAVVAARGVDLTDHRSQPLTVDLITAADLVIGMTRDHVGAVVARSEDALDRAFLLNEFTRLARAVEPRGPDEPFRDWIHRVSSTRPRRLPVGHAQDQIDDPAGQPLDVYEAVAARMERAIDALVSMSAVPHPEV